MRVIVDPWGDKPTAYQCPDCHVETTHLFDHFTWDPSDRSWTHVNRLWSGNPLDLGVGKIDVK